jgi:hypothetical protein
MAPIVRETLEDLRCGRKSWRVMATLSVAAFIIAIAVRLVA